MPSRLSDEDEPPVFSPLAVDNQYRFRRGLVTHKLLQFLPDMPVETWQKSACDFVSKYGGDLPDNVQNGIVIETLAVLNNPDWAPLFGPDSQAEVSVSGMVGGKLISAQIDRLYVTDKSVWIVDFKSNRPSPPVASAIPIAYKQQMKYYSDIVASIYSDREIKVFLLWTDGPHLMEVGS